LGNAPVDSPTPWFHGQVIDMLYFPIFEFVWPDWVPYLGGKYFEFFSPVFNIADSSIFLGVVTILIMQKKFFKEVPTSKKENTETTSENADSLTAESSQNTPPAA
jgi:signal peptidase II